MSFYLMSSTYPYSLKVSSVDPLSFPSVNGHVLVVGSSGAGKSVFANHLFPAPDGLMLFKPDSLYASRRDFLKDVPSPFFFKPYDVADAYLYALGIDFSGIMASSLIPVVMHALSNGSFVDFWRVLGSYGKDGLLSSVASVVKSHFEVLYPPLVEKPEKKPVGRPRKVSSVRVLPPPLHPPPLSDRFFDFSGMGKFRAEFGAELVLRYLYSRLDGSFGVMLIDEFHHVAKPNSVLDTLLREFRVSGRLVGVSQSLSDVAPSMLSNFGSIFVGRGVHALDLKFLDQIDGKLPRLVVGLPAFCFLALHEYVSTGRVVVYRWFDD